MMNARKFILAYTLVLFAVVSTGASEERPADDAKFVKQSVPKTMVAGKGYEVSITMKNTGTAPWTGLKRLGSQSPEDNKMWGMARVDLSPGDNIKPSETKTFKFNVQAPPEAGTHDFQWQMVVEGVKWFGEMSPNVKVKVSAVGSRK